MELPRGTEVSVKNGTFTIFSDATGNHRTFRIATARKGTLKGKRILSILTGPDNTRNYTGFAFVDEHGIHVWGKYRNTGDWMRYAHLIWKFATEGRLTDDKHIRVGGLPAGLLFQGTCCRCNRPLTVPSSIESGIGPICAEKK